jgi:hypothetical protein
MQRWSETQDGLSAQVRPFAGAPRCPLCGCSMYGPGTCRRAKVPYAHVPEVTLTCRPSDAFAEEPRMDGATGLDGTANLVGYDRQIGVGVNRRHWPPCSPLQDAPLMTPCNARCRKKGAQYRLGSANDGSATLELGQVHRNQFRSMVFGVPRQHPFPVASRNWASDLRCDLPSDRPDRRG